MDVLKITFDHLQQRLKTRSARIALLGEELYDEQFTGSGNVMLLPGANCLCLRPYQLDAAYDSSNTGNYTKYTIGVGYEVNDSAKWKPFEDYPSAGTFQACDDSVGEYIRTSAVVGLNRPMVLTLHDFSAKDKRIIVDFGYDDTVTDPETADIGFKLWSDGTLELWKDGLWLADLRLQITANEHNRLIIFPCKRREIVVFTVGYAAGQEKGKAHDGIPAGVARYVFDDIDETETAPVITPDTKFFVRAGGNAGGSVKVQFQPLTFPANGTALSRTWSFGKPPLSGAELFDQWYNPGYPTITTASLYADPAYSTVTDSDDIDLVEIRTTSNGDFTPNGVTKQVKIRVRLTSNGNYTSFAYGVVMQYDRVVTFTGTDEFDGSPWFTQCALQVPDEPFGAKANVTMLGALEAESAGVETVTILDDVLPDVATQSNRPVKFQIGGNPEFLDATVRQPNKIDGIRAQVERVTFEAQSVFRMLEKYQFVTRMPFDGFPLCVPYDWATSAVSMVLREAGVIDVAKFILSDLGYIIGQVPHEQCAEWNVAAEVGDTALEVLEKLHRLASDCFMGEHPGPDGPEFWFLTPEDLAARPSVLTLYRDKDTAKTLHPSLTDDQASELQYHSFHEETLELEATEVWATGLNPRTGAMIQSYAEDTAASDPELPPSARPSNWVGYPQTVGISARSFRQQEDTDRAVEALLPIATQQLTVGEFQANTLLMYQEGDIWLPVWRGDTVTLDGFGDKQISSLTASFDKEVPDDNGRLSEGYYSRSARYTTGAILGKGGTTMRQIQANQERNSFEQYIRDLRRFPLEATGIIAVRDVTP